MTFVLVSGSKFARCLRRGIEIDLVLEWGSKLIWFQWWGRSLLGFCVRDRNWLGLLWGSTLTFSCAEAKIDFVFVCGQKLLSYKVWIEIGLVFVCGPKVTCFSVDDRNWLGFCMRVESHLVLVWASKLTWFLCGWSKLPRFQCGGWKLTWFQCRDEIDLGSVGGRNWLDFSGGIGIDFDFR